MTDARHSLRAVEALASRFLLAHLDGRHGRAELAAALGREVAARRLELPGGGRARRSLAAEVERRLEELMHDGRLLEEP